MTKEIDPPEALYQKLLLDLKWRKFLKLTKWFRFVPFVKFVMANGSMVLGTADKNSDFDVLIATDRRKNIHRPLHPESDIFGSPRPKIGRYKRQQSEQALLQPLHHSADLP